MAEKVYKNRVREKYEKEVVPFLMKKFGYKSVMQCPKLVKIVLNTGLGDIKDNAKSIQTTENEIKMISRTEAHSHEGEEIGRQLQGERGADGGHQGDAPRRKDVQLLR